MRTTALTLLCAAATAAALLVAAPASAAPAASVARVVPASSGPAPAGHPHATVKAVRHPLHMGDYAASRFAKQAAVLPSSLAQQLKSKLGITPAEFLADGQAAADASTVVAQLRARGVDVTGSRMSGTRLTVSVATAADEAAVRAAGASATVAPAQPVATARAEALGNPANGTSPLQGGDLWAYLTDSAGDGIECSVGFNGTDAKTHAREFLTAGHCADYTHTGEPAPISTTAYVAADETPAAFASSITPSAVGALQQSSFGFGGGRDSGLVSVTASAAKTQATVTTWGSDDTTANGSAADSRGVQSQGADLPILGEAAAIAGEPVCHSGARTGWTCGTVQDVNVVVSAAVDAGSSDGQQVDSFSTDMCSLQGDSGGSVVTGNFALGLLSSGTFGPVSSADSTECSPTASIGTSAPATFVFPMLPAASGQQSVKAQQPNFVLATAMPSTSPRLTIGSSGMPTALSGVATYPGSTPVPAGTPVSVSIDGQAAVDTTTAANAGGQQAWQYNLTGVTSGAHSYKVTVGTAPAVFTTSGTFDAPLTAGKPTVSGQARPDATITAKATVSPHAKVSYRWIDEGTSGTGNTAIAGATSKSFAPTAALVGHKLVMRVIATELGASVTARSAPVTVTALPSGVRLAGADRYATAIAISKDSYPTGTKASTVFIASGENFPDALSAAPAAVKLGGPLLLTLHDSLLASVRAEVTRLAPKRIVVVGGTASLSNGVVSALERIAPTVRVGGADRYATSLAIAKYAFGSASVPAAFVATGVQFPDALSASAYAGAHGMPVLLVYGKGTSVPAALSSWLTSKGTTTLDIAGGTAAVTSSLQSALQRVTGHTASRFAGADRFATNQLIDAHYSGQTRAYLAAGANFPDALAGAAAAGKVSSPLYLVQQRCMAAADIRAIANAPVTAVRVLGGAAATGSLAPAYWQHSCG